MSAFTIYSNAKRGLSAFVVSMPIVLELQGPRDLMASECDLGEILVYRTSRQSMRRGAYDLGRRCHQHLQRKGAWKTWRSSYQTLGTERDRPSGNISSQRAGNRSACSTCRAIAELARPMPPRRKSLFVHGRVTLLAAMTIRGVRMDLGDRCRSDRARRTANRARHCL
jgi:hypothetical protein